MWSILHAEGIERLGRRCPGGPAPRTDAAATDGDPRLPPELRDFVRVPRRTRGFAGFAEDFAPGDVIAHTIGKTVSDAEHMQLAFLFRNSHPLHFDEVYCKGGASFAGTRVVYGGLVFSWVATLASRDTCGNVVWDARYDGGAGSWRITPGRYAVAVGASAVASQLTGEAELAGRAFAG